MGHLSKLQGHIPSVEDVNVALPKFPIVQAAGQRPPVLASPGIMARSEAIGISCLDCYFGSIIGYNVNLPLNQDPNMSCLTAFGANVRLNAL